VNFDAGNFSLIEFDVLDMMQSKTHFWQICEIMCSGFEPTISGSRPWPFRLTWRHWSCDHLLPEVPFSYMCCIVTESASQAIFNTIDPNILGSWPWPWLFKFTWHHWSRNQSIRHMPFPIGVPLELRLLSSTVLRYSAPKLVCTHTDTQQVILYSVPCKDRQ